MPKALSQIYTLAAKEISDSRRSAMFATMTLFMLGAGAVALLVAALALQVDVKTYQDAFRLLQSMGMATDALAPPTYVPLRLLRGFIEYIEIIGAVLGIILGHKAAASERACQTLPLLMSRPLSSMTFIAGKCLGNFVLIAASMACMFALGAMGMVLIGGVGLSADDLLRITLSFAASVLYVGFFFMLAFLLALRMRSSAHAILVAFTLWLGFVLIAPQIGDTLDPDNQVGAGVFHTLGIPKAQEIEIMKSFKTYETVRNGIEESSPAKHFERWTFALLEIKDTYVGQKVSFVVTDRQRDAVWLITLFGGLLAALLFLPGNVAKFTEDSP